MFKAPKDTQKYLKYFSENGFFDKAKSLAKKASRPLLERALLLYYTAQNPHTPQWARNAIYGALGYFILPLDLIPDVLLPIGYTDDLAVLAAALATVASYTDASARAYTAAKLDEWLGKE